MEIVKSEEDLIRMVVVGYVPRKSLRTLPYKSIKLERKTVAVQRLMLLVPVEDLVNVQVVPDVNLPVGNQQG